MASRGQRLFDDEAGVASALGTVLPCRLLFGYCLLGNKEGRSSPRWEANPESRPGAARTSGASGRLSLPGTRSVPAARLGGELAIASVHVTVTSLTPALDARTELAIIILKARLKILGGDFVPVAIAET